MERFTNDCLLFIISCRIFNLGPADEAVVAAKDANVAALESLAAAVEVALSELEGEVA